MITSGRLNNSLGRKSTLNQIIKRLVRYFKLSDMKSIIKKIDKGLGRRIRMLIWKRGNKIKTRFIKLQKFGIFRDKV